MSFSALYKQSVRGKLIARPNPANPVDHSGLEGEGVYFLRYPDNICVWCAARYKEKAYRLCVDEYGLKEITNYLGMSIDMFDVGCEAKATRHAQRAENERSRVRAGHIAREITARLEGLIGERTCDHLPWTMIDERGKRPVGLVSRPAVPWS